MQVAQIEDQTTIATLKIEQTHVILSLKNKNESLTKKIDRLGIILQQRFERNDESLAKEGIIISNINQISSIIKDIFIRQQISIAPWVHDYCRPEWKNANMARDNCAASPRKIDQLVNILKDERDLIDGIPDLTNSDMAISYETIIKLKSKYENAARDRHLILPGHEEHDPKTTPVTTPEITEEWKAVEFHREVALKKYQDYVQKFPGPPEKRRFWCMGWMEASQIFIDITNEKATLPTSEWQGRIQYMFHQSKHGAAVKDEIETMICDNCWDDETGKEKEDCNAEMEWDPTSITRYRCTTCGGIKGKLRGLTREQCGDNKSPVLYKAQRLVNNLPGYFESLDKRLTEVNKRIGARRISLSVDLQKKA